MSIDTYPVPSNVTIWIGENKLDDSFRVDWRAASEKTPLYGWADNKYRAVADGRELVTGRLVVNYRFPGYLATAITNAAGSSRLAPEVQAEREKLRTRLRTLREGTSADKARTLLQTLQKGNLTEFHRHEALLNSMFSADLSNSTSNAFTGIPSTTLDSAYERKVAQGPFDIRVIYGQPHLDSYHIEKRILGVHLVGESQVISSSATGGGDISSSGSPIYEVYSFLAREVKELVRQPAIQKFKRVQDGTPNVSNLA